MNQWFHWLKYYRGNNNFPIKTWLNLNLRGSPHKIMLLQKIFFPNAFWPITTSKVFWDIGQKFIRRRNFEWNTCDGLKCDSIPLEL